MKRNKHKVLRQPVLVGAGLGRESVIKTYEEDVVVKSKSREDEFAKDDPRFLEPVFDENACASYKLFKEFGTNDSMRILLWAWDGDYHKLRKIMVCGIYSQDQQEIPARLLFSEYGFLSDVHKDIPENAVVIESLPTADSGTNDPSGYIHGILRSKFPRYKFGFLPFATAETGLTAFHQPVPEKTAYNEPMIKIVYEQRAKSGRETLQQSLSCFESAKSAVSTLLSELHAGRDLEWGGNLGESLSSALLGAGFFDDLTEEELRKNVKSEEMMLGIIHGNFILSEYRRRMTMSYLKSTAYTIEFREPVSAIFQLVISNMNDSTLVHEASSDDSQKYGQLGRKLIHILKNPKSTVIQFQESLKSEDAMDENFKKLLRSKPTSVFFEDLRKTLERYDLESVSFENTGEEGFLQGRLKIQSVLAANIPESAKGAIANLGKYMAHFFNEKPEKALCSVRIFNENNGKSFWNNFCGEIISFERQNINTKLSTLLYTIYCTLISYVFDPKKFVFSYMTKTMKSYLQGLFAKIPTFPQMRSYLERDIPDLQVENELSDSELDSFIQEICSSLNLDLHFYEVSSTKYCVDYSSLYVSRTKRVSPKNSFYEVALADEPKYFSSIENFIPKNISIETNNSRSILCNTQYTVPRIHGHALRIYGDFLPLYQTFSTSLMRCGTTFKQAYREALDLITQTSYVFRDVNTYSTINPDQTPAEWLVRGSAKNPAFHESYPMSVQKAQSMLNLIIVSHYDEIVKFYYSESYKTAENGPKKIKDQLGERDLWAAFLAYVHDIFDQYVLMPIDFEVLAQYLNVCFIFLTGSKLIRQVNALCQVRRSSFEGGIDKISTDRWWFTNANVKWIFGTEENFKRVESAERTFVFATEGLRAYQVGSEPKFRINKNKNFLKISAPADQPILQSLENLRFKSRNIATPQFSVSDVKFESSVYYSTENILRYFGDFFDITTFKRASENEDSLTTIKHLLSILGEIQEPISREEVRETWNEIMSDIDSTQSFAKLVYDVWNRLPIPTIHLIAKTFKRRIMIFSLTPLNSAQVPSAIFQFSLNGSYDFDYKTQDDEKDYILVKQEVFFKGDEEKDLDNELLYILNVGFLPPGVRIPRNFKSEKNEEENLNTKFQSSLVSQQLGVKAKSIEDTIMPKSDQWISPIPIHIYKRNLEVTSKLDTYPQFAMYKEMFEKHEFQPIIITHRSEPVPIKSFSVKCYMNTIDKATDESAFESSDFFTHVDGNTRIISNTFFEMAKYDEVCNLSKNPPAEAIPEKSLTRPQQEARERKKINLFLKVPESQQLDSPSGKISYWIDIMKSIRITMLASNKYLREGNEFLVTNNEFLENIENCVPEATQRLFKLFSKPNQNAPFMRYDSKKKVFQIDCMGVWHFQNVNLTKAMQLVTFFVEYLKHGESFPKKWFRVNEYDKAVLKLLENTQRRWSRYGVRPADVKEVNSYDDQNSAYNATDAFLTKMDDFLYNNYHKRLARDNRNEFERVIQEDIAALSIVYHLEFRQVLPFGKFASNSFIDKLMFPYVSGKIDGTVKSVKQFSSSATSSTKTKIQTVTGRLYYNTNFPPWVDMGTDLDEVPKVIYDRANKYDKFNNTPRLAIYVLKLPPDETPCLGSLLLKLRMVRVSDSVPLGDIRDNYGSKTKDKDDDDDDDDGDQDAPKAKSKRESKSSVETTDKGKDDGVKKEKKKGADGALQEDCPEGNRRKASDDGDDGDGEHRNRRYGGSNKRENQQNIIYQQDGKTFRMDGKGRKHYVRSDFNISAEPFDPAVSAALDEIQTRDKDIWAEGQNKEIFMLSSTLPVVITMLENLNDQGFFTNKMNKGLTLQSMLLTTMLMPCFKSVTAYPITNTFTDHLLFAGRGFSSDKMVKYRVLDRLKGCLDLSRESVLKEYEKLRDDYDDRARWDAFERRVASCSEKLNYDNGVNIFKMAQVIIEGSLAHEVTPGSATQKWLTPELSAALNQRVFRHIRPEDQARNQRLMLEILESPLGNQLRPAFDPVIVKLHPGPRKVPRAEYYESDE